MKKPTKSLPQCSVINFVGIRCGFRASEENDKCEYHLNLEKLQPISDPPFLEDGSPAPNPPASLSVKFDSAQEFAKALLESPEFYTYILEGLQKQSLPATIILRLMDYAEGWGKPPDRVEHTGKNGEAIVTEVRRVIVHTNHEEPKPITESEVIEIDDDDMGLPMIPTAPRRMH